MSDATNNGTVPVNAKTSAALNDLVAKSRSSSDVRQRLAAVQWVRALFRYDEAIVIDTLIMLTGEFIVCECMCLCGCVWMHVNVCIVLLSMTVDCFIAA